MSSKQSRKKPTKLGLSDEVRQIQKAAAVLACIQLTAKHDNEVEADLADAIEVVLDVITAAAIRIEARVSSVARRVNEEIDRAEGGL